MCSVEVQGAFRAMGDSGILPLACILAIHGGHGEDERHMDVLEASP